ncbi:hypothetical protein Nepgr_013793 [Nepenthes gracilis]|uniref:Uncharacterized protein n=1 Tax=Nepenthes gracilis TaxID=150966 RepID=A0AAD3XNZ1_NEPGR|nr:hypothetical protein Nepgr_013793 [Nepenthes gracilis]
MKAATAGICMLVEEVFSKLGLDVNCTPAKPVFHSRRFLQDLYNFRTVPKDGSYRLQPDIILRFIGDTWFPLLSLHIGEDFVLLGSSLPFCQFGSDRVRWPF